MGRMASYIYPYMMENKSHVWKHQPVLIGGFNSSEKYEFVNGVGMTSLFYEMENHPAMFQTTNQSK